jgi:hypothetical protein
MSEKAYHILQASFCMGKYTIPFVCGADTVVSTPLFTTNSIVNNQILFTFNPLIQDESYETLCFLANKQGLTIPKPALLLVLDANENQVLVPNESLPLKYAMLFRDTYKALCTAKCKDNNIISTYSVVDSTKNAIGSEEWMKQHMGQIDDKKQMSTVNSENQQNPLVNGLYKTCNMVFELEEYKKEWCDLIDTIHSKNMRFEVTEPNWESSSGCFNKVQVSDNDVTGILIQKLEKAFRSSHSMLRTNPKSAFFSEGRFALTYLHTHDPSYRLRLLASCLISKYVLPSECLSTGWNHYSRGGGDKSPRYKNHSSNGIFAAFYMSFVNAGFRVSDFTIES